MTWVTDYWTDEAKTLQELLDLHTHHGLEWDFLHRDGGALGGLVTTDPALMVQECAYLVNHYNREELQRILMAPAKLLRSIQTSVHHLYLLTKWREKVQPGKIERVIEWGGGYGDMAVMVKSLYPEVEYVIVDLPAAVTLQREYIPEALGIDYAASPLKIEIGECDLFISTWALSESGSWSHDHVIGKNWFGARHLLLAYEPVKPQFPDTERFLTLLPPGSEPGLPPGSMYLFR